MNETPTNRPRPRRARMLGVVAGLLAVAAVLPAGASAKQTVVPTAGWMQYQPFNTSVDGFFFGNLTAGKKVCESNRVFDIQRSDDGGVSFHSWKTMQIVDGRGGFSVDMPSRNDEGRPYRLVIEKSKVVKANGKKILCLGDVGSSLYAG